MNAVQANTRVYSNGSPAAKAGASTTLTVLVDNTDNPPSNLYLDGAHSHQLTMARPARGLGSGLRPDLRSTAVAGRFGQRGGQSAQNMLSWQSPAAMGDFPVSLCIGL